MKKLVIAALALSCISVPAVADPLSDPGAFYSRCQSVMDRYFDQVAQGQNPPRSPLLNQCLAYYYPGV